MSQHNDEFERSSMSDMFAQFADTVTYTPSVGDASSFAAIFRPVQPIRSYGNRGTATDATATLVIDVDDATPKQGETFTIAGDKWTAKTVKPLGEQAWCVELTRVTASEVSRPNLRRGY